jgi:hypothetical protein
MTELKETEAGKKRLEQEQERLTKQVAVEAGIKEQPSLSSSKKSSSSGGVVGAVASSSPSSSSSAATGVGTPNPKTSHADEDVTMSGGDVDGRRDVEVTMETLTIFPCQKSQICVTLSKREVTIFTPLLVLTLMAPLTAEATQEEVRYTRRVGVWMDRSWESAQEAKEKLRKGGVEVDVELYSKWVHVNKGDQKL